MSELRVACRCGFICQDVGAWREHLMSCPSIREIAAVDVAGIEVRYPDFERVLGSGVMLPSRVRVVQGEVAVTMSPHKKRGAR